jgi:hypothetical protein
MAAALYRRCRRGGEAIRRLIDCLIGAVAIREQTPLLHTEADLTSSPDTRSRGFATVWPDGVTRPTASNLNFVANQTIPNLVVVPVGSDGKIDIFNGGSGTSQYVGDVVGWFNSSASCTAGVCISPSTISFDNQGVNTTSSPMLVTVNNNSSVSLNLGQWQITGTNNADFSDFASGTTCTSSEVLPPQHACTMAVTFTPAQTGARVADLDVPDFSGDTVPLTGTGT